jgi:peptidoglycan L-alanyl-D-glutamate endopeptidase CwlK
MSEFGKRSRKELKTAHPNLQAIFNEVIKQYDCSVLCGHRGKADQDKAFADGKSKLKWPKSNHNKTPSRAVDVVPFPIDWKNETEFYIMADIVKNIAKRLKIKVSWGGDWKTFRDLPHWELS